MCCFWKQSSNRKFSPQKSTTIQTKTTTTKPATIHISHRITTHPTATAQAQPARATGKTGTQAKRVLYLCYAIWISAPSYDPTAIYHRAIHKLIWRNNGNTALVRSKPRRIDIHYMHYSLTRISKYAMLDMHNRQEHRQADRREQSQQLYTSTLTSLSHAIREGMAFFLKGETMTKKDYVVFADMFKSTRSTYSIGGKLTARYVIDDLILAVAGVLQRDNPRFDKERFMTASDWSKDTEK